MVRFVVLFCFGWRDLSHIHPLTYNQQKEQVLSIQTYAMDGNTPGLVHGALAV